MATFSIWPPPAAPSSNDVVVMMIERDQRFAKNTAMSTNCFYSMCSSLRTVKSSSRFILEKIGIFTDLFEEETK